MKPDFEKLLLQESSDAVIATDTAGQVLYWSQGAQAIFGYDSDEAVGHTVYALIVPQDLADEERRILAEALETGFSTYESVRRVARPLRETGLS